VSKVKLGARRDPVLEGWAKLDAVLEACAPYILAGAAVYLVAHVLGSFFAH